MSIGHAIKQARSERGLTQQQLANRAGISITSLYYIESDTNSPSVRTLSKIAAALEVPVSALFEEMDEATQTA